MNRGRWINTHRQTNRKQNKQTNTQKNSRFRNKRISVLVVLVLVLQHLVLVLVFKQGLCHSLTRWLGSLSNFFFFLSFSSSCLVSSSLSEVWQFEFLYYPQVLENSSVAHQPSCFLVVFLLCCFTGGLFLNLTTFLWGKIRDWSAGSLLSEFYDG
jgi:hypothetical protein